MWSGVRNIISLFGKKSPIIKHNFNISPEEYDFLQALFCPEYFVKLSGVKKGGMSDENLFILYINDWFHKGTLPSPLIDEKILLKKYGSNIYNDRKIPLLLYWIREKKYSEIIPTPLFDPSFYLNEYEEIGLKGVDPFEHYVRHGIAEGRRPNGIFDPQFYMATGPRRAGEEGMPGYLHYLTFGIERGAAPSALLAPTLVRTAVDRANGLAAYERAVAIVGPMVEAIGLEYVNVLLGLFHPYEYDGDGNLPSNATGIDRLSHFFEIGYERGIDPGPLFDSAIYIRAAKLERAKSKKQINPIYHFLSKGRAARHVPTSLFDEAAYKSTWPDMRNEAIWGFEHFLLSGIYEGRRVNGSERQGVWTLPLDSTQGRVHNWQLFWAEAGYPAPLEAVTQQQLVPGSKAGEASQFDLAGQHIVFLRQLFVPEWYARKAGLELALDYDGLFSHYLSVGMAANIAPGPFFDPQLAASLCEVDQSAPAMKVWLERRQRKWAAPTPLFDVEYYRAVYDEFRGADIDLFEHFVVHGLAEQRVPNALFDPAWYDATYARHPSDGDLPAYIHFLLFGMERGHAPSQILLPVFAQSGACRDDPAESFQHLASAARSVFRILGPDKLQALFGFFSPQLYSGEPELCKDASGVKRLEHFLRVGLDAGITPGPFFDPDYYANVCVRHKIMASRKGAPFLHYLRHNWSKRVVPNTIFDEENYQRTQPDIRTANVWGFRHFINHGVFEGRKFDRTPAITVSPRATDEAGRRLANWQMFWDSHGGSSHCADEPIAVQQRRLTEVLQSGLFEELLNRAQALDPSVGDPRQLSAFYAAPSHDYLSAVYAQLFARLGGEKYDVIVTVPWLRTGGADLVACQLAKAVKEAMPDATVLLLRVDQTHLERPDWVPDGVDQALVADILNDIPSDHAEALLYAFFMAIAPKRIINVNSFRIWRLFQRFGKRMATQIDNYGYLFCWDQTPDGLRVGYPSMFYAATSPYLSGIFTDTSYLRDELIGMYRPPATIAERIVPLYSPARNVAPRVTLAEQGIASSGLRKRPSVLWAGRLDRQKRFDLVQEIAQLMPDVDFHCWGQALLDSPPDPRRSPKNLKLKPGFKDLVDLPLANADLWLFTSAWEGMPTILIELATLGMSVVASQVGGVPELVNGKTGFAVDAIDSPEAYAAAIRLALDNPELRVQRAKELQKLARRRYSQSTYINCIKDVFDRER